MLYIPLQPQKEETGDTRGEEKRSDGERKCRWSGLWKMDGDNKRKELVNHERGEKLL